MRHLAAITTMACFLIVSMLENNALYVCAFFNSCVVITSEKSEPAPVKIKGCGDYESACSGNACETFEPTSEISVSDYSRPRWRRVSQCRLFSAESQLTAVIVDSRYEGPEMPATGLLSPDAIFEKASSHLLLSYSQPRGVHPLISTTVLRL